MNDRTDLVATLNAALTVLAEQVKAGTDGAYRSRALQTAALYDNAWVDAKAARKLAKLGLVTKGQTHPQDRTTVLCTATPLGGDVANHLAGTPSWR